MLYRLPLSLAIVSALALGACATAPTVSRNAAAVDLETMPLARQETALRQQADVLTARTAEILRKSTLRGAGLGAAAGCGLGLATGAGATRCMGGALAGGAIGAVTGHAQGQAEVKKRIEIVDPSPLVSGIAKANSAMAGLQADLPAMIAAQDAELIRLRAVNGGEAAYQQRLAEIATMRERLFAALDLSSRQAQDTVAALRAAQDQGQDGLDWHVHQALRLGQDATSARSAISLL